MIKLATVFGCVCMLGVSYAQQFDANQQHLLDLRALLPKDSFQELVVGERTLPLLTGESNLPMVKGVAVLVSDVGRPPGSQYSLAPLAEPLNDLGWVTMQVSAPDTAFRKPSISSDTTTSQFVNASSGIDIFSDVAFAQHAQELEQQLIALTQLREQYPGRYVIIAQGTSAAWLTKAIAEASLASPDAMVVINPFWPVKALNDQIPNFLSATTMPVLDIHNASDNQWAKYTIDARQQASARTRKLKYRQRDIIGQYYDPAQYAFLSKEIYGWLSSLNWQE